jgi:hypothetical protein
MAFQRTAKTVGSDIRIDEVIVGDQLDLRHDEHADPDRDNPLFFDLANVEAIEHGVGEGQNDDLIGLTVNGLSVSFPPDHIVVWLGHPDHTVDDRGRDNG